MAYPVHVTKQVKQEMKIVWRTNKHFDLLTHEPSLFTLIITTPAHTPRELSTPLQFSEKFFYDEILLVYFSSVLGNVNCCNCEYDDEHWKVKETEVFPLTRNGQYGDKIV